MPVPPSQSSQLLYEADDLDIPDARGETNENGVASNVLNQPDVHPNIAEHSWWPKARTENTHIEIPHGWVEVPNVLYPTKKTYQIEAFPDRAFEITEREVSEYLNLVEKCQPYRNWQQDAFAYLENKSFSEAQENYTTLLNNALYVCGGTTPKVRNTKSIKFWNGDSVEALPSSAIEYRFANNEILLPVLKVIEKSVQNAGDTNSLSGVLLENMSSIREWDVERTAQLGISYLNVRGLGGMEELLDKYEELQDERSSYNKEISEYSESDENGSVSWSLDEQVAVSNDFANNALFYRTEKGASDYDGMPDPIYFEFGFDEDSVFAKALARKIPDLVHTEEEKNQACQYLSRLMGMETESMLRVYKEAYERVGLDVALPHLLQNLRSENQLQRRMSAEILFRLELGRVGVSEQGVEYLGKLYDLRHKGNPEVNLNDPEFFVRRLNNRGTMAVLDPDEGIKGVFNLDLHSQEQIVRAEVRSLLSTELFLPKADESLEDRELRERYLQVFLQDYEKIFEQGVLENTGVYLNTLELHEQGWLLLHFLELDRKADSNAMLEFRDFVFRYGEYGLKAFLTLEYGGKGEEIIEFAKSDALSYEEKTSIFKNYYSLSQSSFTWRGIFEVLQEGVGYEFAPQAHEAFIRKSSEFFRAAQIISSGKAEKASFSDLQKYMGTLKFSLDELRVLYRDPERLSLSGVQQQNEYDKDGNLVENALTTYILNDTENGARIVVSVRPKPTVRRGRVSGGEARINFGIDLPDGESARFGFDLSDYGGELAVSLDMGVGKPDRAAGIWPSTRIAEVLKVVEGSEGGHNQLSFSPEAVEHLGEIAEAFRAYMNTQYTDETLS